MFIPARLGTNGQVSQRQHVGIGKMTRTSEAAPRVHQVKLRVKLGPRVPEIAADSPHIALIFTLSASPTGVGPGDVERTMARPHLSIALRIISSSLWR